MQAWHILEFFFFKLLAAVAPCDPTTGVSPNSLITPDLEREGSLFVEWRTTISKMRGQLWCIHSSIQSDTTVQIHMKSSVVENDYNINMEGVDFKQTHDEAKLGKV